MGNAAFELREEYAGTVDVVTGEDEKGDQVTEERDVFQGGVVAVPPDGESFHVKDQLAKGGGLIVVDASNSYLIATLDDYQALQRVEAPEGAEGISIYESLPVPRLREIVEQRNIEKRGARSKAEFVALLQAADDAVEAGDVEGATDPDPENAQGTTGEGS